MKIFFLSFFLLSWICGSCPLGIPTTKTPDFTLFPPLIFSCRNLAGIALFESEYDSLAGPNTKLEAFALRISLCMTLASALVPLSFYPLTGQCADMVSAPRVFGSSFL